LRFDATQLDAASRNSTPFLKKLAGVGVNFTTTYSTFDSTPPSHFSLLTGFVDGHLSHIDRPEMSIAHQLNQVGYRTFGIAANANLSAEAMRAVMPFQSYENLQDEWLKIPPSRKAALAHELDERIRAYGDEPNDWTRMFLYGSSDEIIRRLVPKIRENGRPFFGFLNVVETHDPYYPDPRHYSRSSERKAPPSLRFRKLPAFLEKPTAIRDSRRRQFVIDKINQAGARAWSTTLDLEESDLQVYRRRYEAEVGDADRAIESIFGVLRSAGVLDTTIIVITSDHGESIGEDQLITHTFYEKGDRETTHRVPLLFVFPPCYRIGGVTLDPVCTIADVAPTIYEILGIDVRPLWELTRPGNFGRSLLPLMRMNRAVSTARASADPAGEISPQERKKQDEEAVKRLRSLGYLGR
jgi:arylsulfatase A-like enzyme